MFLLFLSLVHTVELKGRYMKARDRNHCCLTWDFRWYWFYMPNRKIIYGETYVASKTCFSNSAKPHPSWITSEWLHEQRWCVLDCPTYNPDLFTSENVWCLLTIIYNSNDRQCQNSTWQHATSIYKHFKLFNWINKKSSNSWFVVYLSSFSKFL